MAPTYSYSGDPSSSSLDAVRFAIGDTQSTDWQMSNEEINYLLSGQPSITLAAIGCCKRLIAKYARLATQAVGRVSVQYKERRENYEALLVQLQRDYAPAIYSGGISVSDKESQNEDTDYDKPTFSRHMDERKG